MKRNCVLIVVLISAFLTGCSTLSFIPTPPNMTIATTDYVNKHLEEQTSKTVEEVLTKAQTIIDEALAKERAHLEELKTTMEKQQEDVQKVLASMEEVNTTATQIREIVNRVRRDLGDTKKEMADSLDVVWEDIGKLRTMDNTLQGNLKILENDLARLDSLNQQLKQLTDQMQVRLNGMPKETLQQLQKLIENFYSGKGGN